MLNHLRLAKVTPLDLVKCRRQVNKSLYAGNIDGWKKIIAADGLKGLLYVAVAISSFVTWPRTADV